MFGAAPGGTGSTQLFVYGSLLRRQQLTAVLGHPHSGEQLRARLDGFAKVSVPGYEYVALVPDSQAVTEGMLLMDLSTDEMRSIDAYEDLDLGLYERVDVQVTYFGCGPTPCLVRAQTYVAGPELRRRLSSFAPAPIAGNPAA